MAPERVREVGMAMLRAERELAPTWADGDNKYGYITSSLSAGGQ